MSFRGITLEPIHKNIQIRLNQLEKMHSAAYPSTQGFSPIPIPGDGPDPAPHDIIKLNSKTVWFSLRSNAGVNEGDDVYVRPRYSHLRSAQGGDWTVRSARKSAMPTVDDSGNPQKDFSGPLNLTPPPGIESIGISTKGAMGSIKTADIKLRVFHPEDIAEIEKAYLMPGITLFLEWGWSGTLPIDNGTYKAMQGSGASKKLEELIIQKKLGLCTSYSLMEASLAAETTPDVEVEMEKPGQYDGMLGVITKFNWSLDADGSYGINVSIISPNSLVMGVGLETHLLGATKNTGYKKNRAGDAYETKTKTIEIDGKATPVPAGTRSSLSDAEFLCRAMVKLLKGDGKQIEQYEVETSADVQAAKVGPQKKIDRAKAAIKKYEKDLKDLEKESDDSWEKKQQAYNDWHANQHLQFQGVKGWYVMSNKKPTNEFSMDQDHAFRTQPKVQVVAINAYGFDWVDGMKYEELWSAWDYYHDIMNDRYLAKLDGQAKHDANQEAIIAENEQIIEELGGSVEPDAEGQTEGNSMAYTIKGEGDSKYIYFATDPNAYFKAMTKNMEYFEGEGKIFWKSRKTYGWFAKPDGNYLRNGIPAKYWWQEGEAAPTKGALLAYRAWARKSSGNSYEKKNYVTWRWIEDYLLQQSTPKDSSGNPIISLNSTHIGRPASDVTGETVYYYPNQCINSPIIQSMDYNVCVLFDKQSKAAMESIKPLLATDESKAVISDYDPKVGERFSPDPETLGVTSFGNYATGNIRDILVNIDHVQKVLSSQRTFEGFVTRLLSDINDACGKPWDFTLQANEGDAHVLQVIDKNCTPTAKSVVDKNPVIASAGSVGTTAAETDLDVKGRSDTILTSAGWKNVEITKPAQHYTFKGRGRGNILKKVSMNSKLPKAIQAMAFISNKSHTKNTHNKETADFNIYGGHVVDLFYADGIAAPSKTVKQKQLEYANAKNNIFRDWAYTYNKLFKDDNTAMLSSLSSRQINSQIVSTIVYGTPAQAPKPNPAPRLLPLEMKITLDGISGIYQGNSLQFLTVQDGGILPDRYKDEVVFQITKVQHSISDQGWDTNIDMMMRMIPAEDKEKKIPGVEEEEE